MFSFLYITYKYILQELYDFPFPYLILWPPFISKDKYSLYLVLGLQVIHHSRLAISEQAMTSEMDAGNARNPNAVDCCYSTLEISGGNGGELWRVVESGELVRLGNLLL